MALNLASFGRWMLRDKAAQYQLALLQLILPLIRTRFLYSRLRLVFLLVGLRIFRKDLNLTRLSVQHPAFTR